MLVQVEMVVGSGGQKILPSSLSGSRIFRASSLKRPCFLRVFFHLLSMANAY